MILATADTTVLAAHIIVALQTIASRGVDPLKQVVVSICTVATDSTAHNVIPQQVVMKGTVRTMDFAVQDYVERRVREIAEGTALALGGKAEVTWLAASPTAWGVKFRPTAAGLEVSLGRSDAPAIHLLPSAGSSSTSKALTSSSIATRSSRSSGAATVLARG